MQEFIDRLGREGCWNVEIKKYWEGRMLEFIGRLGRKGYF